MQNFMIFKRGVRRPSTIFGYLILLFGFVGQLANADVDPGKNAFGQPPTEQEQRPYDLRFIDELTTHHEHGLIMAEVATRKAHHTELKEMAQMMAMAHKKELAQLQQWESRWFPAYRAHMDKSIGMDIIKFEQLSGNEFDLAFLDGMIMHHPSAIYLGIEALQKSSRNEVKAFAQKIKTAQIKELDHLRTLRSRWGQGE